MELADDLDAWLLEREADGTLAALRASHLGEGAAAPVATPLGALLAALDERLALMPEHAYLVNTARGEIVDEQALAHALETGAIAGAGLDVYADEPSIPEGLRARDNVVLLPHIGSATIEGRHAMGDKVIINIQTFLDGHTPPDRVLAAML